MPSLFFFFCGVDEDGYESTRHAGTEKSNGWHYTVAFSPYDPETGIVVCLDQNVNEYMRMMDHEYNWDFFSALRRSRR